MYEVFIGNGEIFEPSSPENITVTEILTCLNSIADLLNTFNISNNPLESYIYNIYDSVIVENEEEAETLLSTEEIVEMSQEAEQEGMSNADVRWYAVLATQQQPL